MATKNPLLYTALCVVSLSACQQYQVRKVQHENNSAQIAARAEFSVVAIGWVYDSPDKTYDIKIIGSGFNVDPSGIIVTSEHIIAHHLKKYTDFYKRKPKDTTTRSKLFQFDEKTRLVVLFRIYIGSPQKVKDIGLVVKEPLHVYADEKLDLAVLKLDGKYDLPYIELGDSNDIKIGQRVVVAGYPFGEKLFKAWDGVQVSFAQGMISAILPHAKALEDEMTYIQLDATINPGNSGGPVFLSDSGKVIGVVKEGRASRVFEVIGVDKSSRSLMSLTTIPRGINIAVPINKVKDMIDTIKKVTRDDVMKGKVFDK